MEEEEEEEEFLEGNLSFDENKIYKIRVGKGGVTNANGNNSYIQEDSVNIIESIGGGNGGSQYSNAGSGGCGGGGSESRESKGLGTSGQGFDGCDGRDYNNLNGKGGCGGGAGGAAIEHNSWNEANTPGIGKSSNITGTLKYYGGGGGASFSNQDSIGHTQYIIHLLYLEVEDTEIATKFCNYIEMDSQILVVEVLDNV